MSNDSVTIRLDGDLTIGRLSDAFTTFSQLLAALSKEHGANVEWKLSGLEYGSAIASAQAVALDDASSARISELSDGYLGAARTVANGGVADRLLLRLVSDLTRNADAEHPVVMETAEAEVLFLSPTQIGQPVTQPSTVRALGTVRGRIETLSRKGGLKFSLYDLVTDRAVRCHLTADDESRMRGAWGRVADVTGTITRDSQTGRALTVRDVTGVAVIEEGDPLGYRRARGVLTLTEPAEDIIRHIRDAG